MLTACGVDDPTPREPGVSIALCYPVLLLGQSSVDVRDWEQALTSIRGDSSLNLNERAILDSAGRLLKVKRAAPIAGRRSIMWDMGTSSRRFYVEVREERRPSWPQIQELVVAQLPTSAEAPQAARARTSACARCAEFPS